VDGLNSLPGIDIPFMPAYDRRKSAAHELGVYGPAAWAAVPALLQALNSLNSDDDAVRETAAISLGNIHAEPDTVIPALTQCLGDYGVNAKAVSALGQFGAAAKAAVPRVIILLQANDPETQWAAGEALRKIDPEAFARARNAANNAMTNKAVAGGIPTAK
jgi:HEAT repeat protein